MNQDTTLRWLKFGSALTNFLRAAMAISLARKAKSGTRFQNQLLVDRNKPAGRPNQLIRG